MKTKTPTIRQFVVAAALALASVSVSPAQFTSGSNGSYGALDITTNTTLPMPDDGIFHCTTISVAPGSTLSFAPNARNTPVYLLAVGDVVIEGVIKVTGTNGNGIDGARGGPGGFAGGDRSRQGIAPAGDGRGPGGGVAGASGNFLGSPLLIPLVGGGGGGGTASANGAGGGGAILLASSTLVRLNAGSRINANGGALSGSGRGGGGAVRIVAPRVGGSGLIFVGSPGFGLPVGAVRVDSYTLTNQTWQAGPNVSYGANMLIFPPDLPKLEIIEVAGTPVDPNAEDPVTVEVGEGAPEQQDVKVRATNFGGTAQVTVVVVPEAGTSAKFDLDISNPEPGSGEGTVTVDVPANTVSHLYVWTR